LRAPRAGLTSLPPALFERGGIRRLDLGFNTLGGQQIVFQSPLSSVVELSLWKCGLTELDASISCLSSLTYLNVEENKLRVLPETFVKLRSLNLLRASQNTLCALPKRFGALNNLTDLSMDNNVLETLPSSFSKLVSLKRLSLARNKLPTLEAFMTTLVNLETLNVDGNLITFLPFGLGRLKCRQLSLSFNRSVALYVCAFILRDHPSLTTSTHTCSPPQA
jgi:Leucine-rich repeat (LRR) protein